MITFNSVAQKKSVILFPITVKNIALTSRKLFEGLSPIQRKAVKKIITAQGAENNMPFSGSIPVYTNDGLVIVLCISESIDKYDARKLGESVQPIAKKYNTQNLSICMGSFWKMQNQWKSFIDGIYLGQYEFIQYKGALRTERLEKNPETNLQSITIVSENNSENNAMREAWTTGVAFTKDLINTPPSVATPEYSDIQTRELFKGLKNVKISTIGEKELTQLGAGGILSVGQASTQESRFVVIEYTGGKKEEAPIGFVGKGITYDTGGLSIKPGMSMRGMKKDLGGAATIIGAVYAMAKSELPKNIVAVIPFAENLISEKAYKPDDVITMMNGKTVEVTNTDAEGRLILGDALVYIERTFSPSVLIDAATLTGACAYAIGEEISAVFSTTPKLFLALSLSAQKTEEPIWELPLYSRYGKLIHSKVADLVNAATGFKAGTIQAALFLQHFVDTKTPWAHFDIAYSSFDNKTDMATGKDVRLLLDFAQNWK